MKIVNLDVFLKMPRGTLFSKYAPYCFDGLMIKGNSLGNDTNDFYYQELIGNVDCDNYIDKNDILSKAEKKGKTFILDFDIEGRDGIYDEEQLYAVYEEDDVKGLIKALNIALIDYRANDTYERCAGCGEILDDDSNEGDTGFCMSCI